VAAIGPTVQRYLTGDLGPAGGDAAADDAVAVADGRSGGEGPDQM